MYGQLRSKTQPPRSAGSRQWVHHLRRRYFPSTKANNNFSSKILENPQQSAPEITQRIAIAAFHLALEPCSEGKILAQLMLID